VPHPPDTEYTVPLGESGLGRVGGAGNAYAFVNLFAFEKQHAAAQRRKLSREGIEQPRIDVRIRTGVDEKGRLLPVAGQTEAQADLDGNGAHELVMRELAYISDRRRLFLSSGGSIMGLDARPMPKLRHAGTLASAYRAYHNRNELRARTDRPKVTELFRHLTSTRIEQTLDALEPVEEALQSLSRTLSELLETPALAAAKASSSEVSVGVEVTGPDRKSVV